MDRHTQLNRLAVRLWVASDALDALHGTGDKVWAWTHEKVDELGRDPDPGQVAELVAILERRLAMERNETRKRS